MSIGQHNFHVHPPFNKSGYGSENPLKCIFKLAGVLFATSCTYVYMYKNESKAMQYFNNKAYSAAFSLCHLLKRGAVPPYFVNVPPYCLKPHPWYPPFW